jgi:hypothetical protein
VLQHCRRRWNDQVIHFFGVELARFGARAWVNQSGYPFRIELLCADGWLIRFEETNTPTRIRDGRPICHFKVQLRFCVGNSSCSAALTSTCRPNSVRSTIIAIIAPNRPRRAEASWVWIDLMPQFAQLKRILHFSSPSQCFQIWPVVIAGAYRLIKQQKLEEDWYSERC